MSDTFLEAMIFFGVLLMLSEVVTDTFFRDSRYNYYFAGLVGGSGAAFAILGGLLWGLQ